ncbi:hypothetical protein LEP1GSC127_1035 [Leptospira kirschneri str. 200801925]|nr:hypothetical protein LEP1GSC127_1035 [Leptospira kirschneri str. 200801925]
MVIQKFTFLNSSRFSIKFESSFKYGLTFSLFYFKNLFC